MSTSAVASACVVLVGVSWNLASAGAVADALSAEYGVALATIGLLTTVLFGVQVIGTVPAGRLIDRFGPWPLATAALITAALGNGLLLLAPVIELALAGRAVVGLAVGFGFVAGARMVQNAGGGAVAQGVYGGIGLGAGGVAIALIPLLDGALGWRAPWVSGVAVVAPGLVALGLLARSAPGIDAKAAPRGAPLPEVPLAVLLRDTRLQRLGVVHAASFGFGVVLANWTVPLLQRAGHSVAVAGVLGGLVLFLGIFSRPGGGVLARRNPARVGTLLTRSLLACAVGAGLLAAAPDVLPVAAAGALIAGLAAGVPFGPVLAAAAAARPDAPGTAVAVVNTVGVAVIVAATPLLGLTFTLPGQGRVGIAALAIAAATAAIITARGTAITSDGQGCSAPARVR